MTANAAPSMNLPMLFKSLKHVHLWAAPAVAFLALGLGYCQVRQPTWRATQSLIVRDEAGGGLSRQGRFDNVDVMKTTLETVQEVARSRAVVQAALTEIGPDPDDSVETWPTTAAVERVQAAISVKAPKGAEFGKTEVVHLATTASSWDRALALNKAICRHLEVRYQELRQSKALSIIAELEKSAQLAESELTAATQTIEEMETDVGIDLGELRTLNEMGAGESNLRSTSTQINNELRQVRTQRDANLQLLEQLITAQSNPSGLVTISSRLLESQPALRRLKDGLVDAQLRKAEILGKMSPEHPLAVTAVANEEAVRRDLRLELLTAVEGLRADLKVCAAQSDSFEKQLAEVNARLDKLTGMRARYANLADVVRQRGQIAERARKDLADARATVAAAQSASLISFLDAPEIGDRPVGPGKTAILTACGAGGLMAGFGLLFLVNPLGQGRSRRWSDIADMGRRATDFLRSRRSGDRAEQGRPSGDAGRRGDDRAAGSQSAPSRRAADPMAPPAVSPAAPDYLNDDRERRLGDRRRG